MIRRINDVLVRTAKRGKEIVLRREAEVKTRAVLGGSHEYMANTSNGVGKIERDREGSSKQTIGNSYI